MQLRTLSSPKGTHFPRLLSEGFRYVGQRRVKHWDQIVNSKTKVRDEQLAIMRRIVEVSGPTDYGRRYDMSSVRDYDSWCSRVPLSDYDALSPYIQRMMAGEKDVLVQGRIKYYGNSSGSSNQGKQKFLPISEAQIKQQQLASADAAYRYVVAKDDRDFLSGFTVGLLPPTVMKKEGAAVVTNNPALMFSRLPLFARPLWLPRGQLKKEKDYDRKLKLIAQTYADYNVHAVSGTTCWFSLLFDQLLENASQNGQTIQTVSEIWPNLRVLFGGGVAAAPYLSIIRERVGKDITLVDTYNATEGGLFACTHHGPETGMLMIVDRGVFFEFVPLEEVDSDKPTRVPLWEVETNRNYAIYVSTLSGMCAYRLGDIVRFTSTEPYMIEFAGRLSGCLSVSQELTTHVEIQDAVTAALEKNPAVIVDYTCGADVGVEGSAKAQYVLFVEFAENQTPNVEVMATDFDEALCSLNRVYREHRSGGAVILPAKVVPIPTGTVQTFMKTSGRTSVQTKFPRIGERSRQRFVVLPLV